MSLPRCQHEGSAASLVLVLNVGAVPEQEVDHVPVALPAGQRQGNIVLTARGHIDLCTLLEQQLSHCQVTLPERGRERGREGGRGREGERGRGRGSNNAQQGLADTHTTPTHSHTTHPHPHTHTPHTHTLTPTHHTPTHLAASISGVQPSLVRCSMLEPCCRSRATTLW